eukprot:4434136-Prymnesium_polylepis.1
MCVHPCYVPGNWRPRAFSGLAFPVSRGRYPRYPLFMRDGRAARGWRGRRAPPGGSLSHILGVWEPPYTMYLEMIYDL